MPVAAIAQKLETLNDELLQKASDYISYLQTKQQSFQPERKFGMLEGKVSAKFSDDWTMSDEELLGL